MADGREFVVVVDDEAEARDVLQQILELEGFEVEGFANGAEALDYLNHSVQPCVIILDLLMPVMNGPQFREAMLKDPRLAAIPIVVVTALEPTAAAGLSAVRIFRKPIDVQALVGVVRKHC
jgi:two-component system chemotaxis response regulator CheY